VCGCITGLFPLSFREVEEMMMAREVIVSYETNRAWWVKFGQAHADPLYNDGGGASTNPV
jgi:transposase-like protein